MKLQNIYFVSLILVLLSITIVKSDWEGTWTETTHGGDFHICIKNNELHGVMSELAVIQCDLDDDDGKTATGKFYLPGFFPCNSGSIVLVLSDDEETLDGEWECDDVNKSGTFSEFKTSDTTPNREQCALISRESYSFKGKWDDGILFVDLCVDDDGFVRTSYENFYYLRDEIHDQVEYDPNEIVNGTELGEVSSNGNILQLNWFEEEGLTGESIWLKYEDDSAGVFWFIGEISFGETEVDNTVHGLNPSYSQSSRTPEDCDRFEHYINEDNISSELTLPSSVEDLLYGSSSNSSIIAVSYLLILMIMLVVMNC